MKLLTAHLALFVALFGAARLPAQNPEGFDKNASKLFMVVAKLASGLGRGDLGGFRKLMTSFHLVEDKNAPEGHGPTLSVFVGKNRSGELRVVGHFPGEQKDRAVLVSFYPPEEVPMPAPLLQHFLAKAVGTDMPAGDELGIELPGERLAPCKETRTIVVRVSTGAFLEHTVWVQCGSNFGGD